MKIFTTVSLAILLVFAVNLTGCFEESEGPIEPMEGEPVEEQDWDAEDW